MQSNFPPWEPEQEADFDSTMATASANILRRVQNDGEFRAAVLADPRDLHNALYSPFAPSAYSYYAGNYRGTQNTALEHREAFAPSLIVRGGTFQFIPAADVASSMQQLLPQLHQMRSVASSRWDKLFALTCSFVQFGKIHPFLNGNGHVQRVLFAAGAFDLGIPLSKRFAVHPRSYDRLLAYALECFTRSRSDDSASDWAMAVAEYLAQWLGGPFDSPGSGLPPP